jgi:hypothetical protein
VKGRLAGKRVVVTECNAFMETDITLIFPKEGAEALPTHALRPPPAAGHLIREGDRV